MGVASGITVNLQALIGIVANLFQMIGLSRDFSDVEVSWLISRRMRLGVLRILRPAEAALRRLIFVSAKGIVLQPAQCVRPFPKGLKFELGDGAGVNRVPAFKLCERLPPIEPSGRSRYARKVPRIITLFPTEPTVAAAWSAQIFVSSEAPHVVLSDDRRDAARLVRRLLAIQHALSYFPRQAERFARWTARRAQHAARNPDQFVYTSPLRRGRPRELPNAPNTEVLRVLEHSHLLAFETGFNTS
jgi:hypothetical protein